MKDRHYASAASAFLWTLNQLIGEEFTLQIGEAWTEAFNTMVEVMRDGSVKAADAHVGLLSTNQQDRCKYFGDAFLPRTVIFGATNPSNNQSFGVTPRGSSGTHPPSARYRCRVGS